MSVRSPKRRLNCSRSRASGRPEPPTRDQAVSTSTSTQATNAVRARCPRVASERTAPPPRRHGDTWRGRSEEHTSELQSLRHLVCRLLLEKKKKQKQKKLTAHK